MDLPREFSSTSYSSERVSLTIEPFPFCSIIPQSLLKIYDAGELELLISGLPTIDVDEVRVSFLLSIHKKRRADLVSLLLPA